MFLINKSVPKITPLSLTVFMFDNMLHVNCDSVGYMMYIHIPTVNCQRIHKDFYILHVL